MSDRTFGGFWYEQPDVFTDIFRNQISRQKKYLVSPGHQGEIMTESTCRPLASSAATHAISAIGMEVNGSPMVFNYAGRKIEIRSISGAVTFGFTAKKLFDYMLLLLTRFNRNQGDWKNGTIRFTLRDYMDVMGYDDNRQARGRCFDTICEDLEKLQSIELRQESADWFGLVERHRFVGPEGKKYAKKDILSGKASFEVCFHSGLLTHLSERRYIVPFPLGLFRHVKQNENAYALAKRMILRYKSNCGDAKNKQKLKVGKLLECCLVGTNQRNGNVRQTFEKALSCLATPSSEGGEPLIDWTYIVDGKPRTPEEVSALRLSHEDWRELVVKFDPVCLLYMMKSADRNSPGLASNTLRADENAERMTMRKKKTDPKLHTPNAFLQRQLGLVPGSTPELMLRRFESLVCEQIWLAKETPTRIIRNLRDADGYLLLKDVEFPITLLTDWGKKLSLSACLAEPMSRLLWDPLFGEEERVLAVARWSGGNGPYAQVGILKHPKDVLRGKMVGSLIKRDHEGHVYYFGRLFDLLTAMFDAELLPPWEEEFGDDDERDSL